MIKSKKDYLYYLECDKIALGRKTKRPKLVDEIWKFQRLMRKLEYYMNCKNGLYKPYKLYLKYKYHKLSTKLGFEIPINIIGPGLSIAHRGLIVINGQSKIGANFRIHTGVNIGTAAGYSSHAKKVPKLGNNVYIGPGVKIYGDVSIGDNVAIGANAVVNKSFEANVTVAGVPAKIINHKGSEGLVRKATEMIGNF